MSKHNSNNNIADIGSNITELNCARCGKIYIPTPEWVYKDSRGRGYCGWPCYNHRNDGKKPPYRAVECVFSDGTVASSFQSPTKAAEWVGTSPTRIIKAIDSGTKVNGYLWRYKDNA